MWRCPACGIFNSKELVCRYCHAPAPTGAVTDPPFLSWSFLQWYRFLRLVVGGVLCLSLGIWLMVDPKLRQDPKALTIAEIGPGLGACVAGLLMLGMSFLAIRRQKKD